MDRHLISLDGTVLPSRLVGKCESMITPALGTVITGEGKVVFRDETGYGLQRMCVSTQGKYPDVETWTALLENRDLTFIKIRYTEKMVAHVFTGYLWFYWKEG